MGAVNDTPTELPWEAVQVKAAWEPKVKRPWEVQGFRFKTGGRVPYNPIFRMKDAGDGGHLPDEFNQGTAFFVAQNIFVTAAHIVASEKPRTGNILEDMKGGVIVHDATLLVDEPSLDRDGDPLECSFVFADPPNLFVDWKLDLAIGRVSPTTTLNGVWRLASEPPQVGDPVLSFGYPDSQIRIVGDTQQHNLDGSVKAEGFVTDDAERPGTFRHSAWTRGGMSGGPIVNMKNGWVCGLNSRSAEGATNQDHDEARDLAINVCEALDVELPFLGGLTLRHLCLLDDVEDPFMKGFGGALELREKDDAFEVWGTRFTHRNGLRRWERLLIQRKKTKAEAEKLIVVLFKFGYVAPVLASHPDPVGAGSPAGIDRE